jgi:hypothetical protein
LELLLPPKSGQSVDVVPEQIPTAFGRGGEIEQCSVGIENARPYAFEGCLSHLLYLTLIRLWSFTVES